MGEERGTPFSCGCRVTNLLQLVGRGGGSCGFVCLPERYVYGLVVLPLVFQFIPRKKSPPRAMQRSTGPQFRSTLHPWRQKQADDACLVSCTDRLHWIQTYFRSTGKARVEKKYISFCFWNSSCCRQRLCLYARRTSDASGRRWRCVP